MAMSVKDLIKLDSLNKLKLVAGKNGIDNYSEWVYVAECFDDPLENIKWIQGHEIVIITGRGIREDKQELTKVIKAISDKNGAALIINIGTYIKKIPKEALDAADELGLPLFELPWEEKIVEISQNICKSILYSRNDRNSSKNFFSEMIFGDAMDDEKAIDRASFYGYDLSGKCNVCICSPDNIEEYIKEKNLNNKQVVRKIKSDIVKILEVELEKHYLKSPVIERSDSIIFINRNDGNAAKKLKPALNDIQQNINNKMDGLKVSIGIGNSYDSLSQIKKSYNEANLSLKCARFESKENTIISYEKIGVYGLLFSIKDKSILEQYYFNTLGEVQKYDNLNDTELLKTLEVYLSGGCNVTTTADELFIHRNTLKYRTGKIEELLECDLHDFRTCERLQVAFDIRKIIM